MNKQQRLEVDALRQEIQNLEAANKTLLLQKEWWQRAAEHSAAKLSAIKELL